MNILVAASTMHILTSDESEEGPSLSLKVARVVGNICVSSLDLLCVARLIPCPSQRLLSYDLIEPRASRTEPENILSVENPKTALNVRRDFTTNGMSERESRRKDFYTEIHCKEERKIDNEDHIINNVEGALQQKPTTSKSVLTLQVGKVAQVTDRRRVWARELEDAALQMEQEGLFNAFMLDILYRNDALVEIMTPSEFKEYCKNLFKKQTGTEISF